MSQDEAAVNEPVVMQEPTTTESAPVETKAPEVADSFDEVWDVEQPAKSEDESKEDPDSDEVSEEAEPAAEPSEEQPATKATERKQQLNTEIRDLVAQRNALKGEVEKLNAETYQAPSVEDLVAEGMDETRAMVESMRQQQEIDKYNSQVVDAQMTLESESSHVLRDFPMFDPQNESYQPDVAQKAAELLQQNLVVDPNTGQVIGSHISPYKLYETIAAAHQVSAVENQIKGQQATERMLANADLPSNAAPAKAKADPILEIWKD